MRTWDTFYPYVLPEVLGCPEPMLDQHLIGAAREFCAQTKCWREVLETIYAVGSETSYDIYYARETEAVTLIGATLDGQDIAIDVPDAASLGDRTRGTAGRGVRSTDLVTIQFLFTPGNGQKLVLEAILQPKESAVWMPDAIADRYKRQIARGAVASLLDMNQQQWTNNALASKRRREFEADIGSIKSRIWRGNSNARPRHAGQFF